MTAFLNVDGEIWLLLGQLLDQSSSVSKSLSDFHSYLTLRLLCVIKLPAIQDKFLVLEEHSNFQEGYWISQLF